MKTIIALLTATALCAAPNYFGNDSNPNALLVPYGIWQLCESPTPVQAFCSNFKAGQEQYLLLLKATMNNTEVYHYKVSGTRADGLVIQVEGVVLRADNTTGVTSVPVSLGAPIADAQVTVEER